MALSVSALLGHGVVALPLLNGTAPTDGAKELAWCDQPGSPVGAGTLTRCEQRRQRTRLTR